MIERQREFIWGHALKKTITPAVTPPSWDPNALYLKVERYVQHMSALDSDDWEYALWSSLSLEFLARAALANVSLALLAEADKNWSSLYHALGFTPTEEKFAPKSIAISEVFRRLAAILPDFTNERESSALGAFLFKNSCCDNTTPLAFNPSTQILETSRICNGSAIVQAACG